MKKTIYAFLIIIALAVLGVYFSICDQCRTGQVIIKDHKNATYVINDQEVLLVNGFSEVEAAPGSASKITTRYFGNEAVGDLDGDGRMDVFFILTQETGGSGIFYYAVAALNKPNGYVGSDAVLLGDRISPQSTEIRANNIVVVNYADRAQGESFSVQPSIGKSIWLKLDTNTMRIGEVGQNFEGEADPSRMEISMKTWNWIRTTYTKGIADVTPKKEGVFKVTFNKDKTFSASTDCNGIGGEYVINTQNKSIVLQKMMSTLMFCEGSQESIYGSMLAAASSYEFTSKGELVLKLKDGGMMFFR